MKKKILSVICTVIAGLTACAVLFAGCTDGNNITPKEYTIQYTDDSGTHTLTVTEGMPYALEAIPQKSGYTFTGLFNAETGGVQYVGANGASLAPFSGDKNLVLFPQFEAKSYTVILDYQGAVVTGSREFTVAYNTKLPDLPKTLNLEHKTFSGWYTKANCEGTQIADEYGLLPVVLVLNDTNFDLSGEYVYLYAGFATEKFTVTCYFESGTESEKVEAEYDTPVSEIVTNTRVDGKAPLSWSETRGGEVFNGRITRNMTLYALEYAPVIELDSNGGSKVNPVIARAGTTISLPVPTKDLANFAYWEDISGNRFTATAMPAESTTLKAVWQAKLVLDENGGTDVDDISVVAGEKITLPTPEKDGYIFAGWYTADKEQYTSTTMPAAGVVLKAGWYRNKEKVKTFLSNSENSSIIYYKTPKLESRYYINLNEEVSEIDWSQNLRVKINFYADFKHVRGEVANREEEGKNGPEIYATKEHFYFYSQPQVSDAYLIGKNVVDHGNGMINENYTQTNFSIILEPQGGIIYTALGADKDSDYYSFGWHYGSGWRMRNFWCKIEYPDTTNLYL